MEHFFSSFKKFCVGDAKDSGKATSYSNSIKYLFEYLKLDNLSDSSINKIKELENKISNKSSLEYSSLNTFLTKTHGNSYLTGNFIKSALPLFYKFLKIYNKTNNTPLFFANITWMTYYDGKEEFLRTSTSYVREHNDAYEKHNFSNINGKCYGFIQCSRNGNINLETIAKKYNVAIKSEINNKYIENITIVFFSKPGNSTSKIVGFYKNATIFEKSKTNENGNTYYVVCNSDDAFLIPINERIFEIPKKIGDTYLYGQDMRWYAVDNKLDPFLNDVRKYINTVESDDKFDADNIKDQVALLKEVKDKDVSVCFDKNKINGILPINTIVNKNNTRKLNGTSMLSSKKIISGRKAEKYFMDFLLCNKFKQNEDFRDVANDKKYGFDLLFKDIGLEIKNIRSGSFYLTDSEIVLLQNNLTHLILVDIDNGIWLLKNTSPWLNTTIQNISAIKNTTLKQFEYLEINDIKIHLTETLKSDDKLIEISRFNKTDILKALVD